MGVAELMDGGEKQIGTVSETWMVGARTYVYTTGTALCDCVHNGKHNGSKHNGSKHR